MLSFQKINKLVSTCFFFFTFSIVNLNLIAKMHSSHAIFGHSTRLHCWISTRAARLFCRLDNFTVAKVSEQMRNGVLPAYIRVYNAVRQKKITKPFLFVHILTSIPKSGGKNLSIEIVNRILSLTNLENMKLKFDSTVLWRQNHQKFQIAKEMCRPIRMKLVQVSQNLLAYEHFFFCFHEIQECFLLSQICNQIWWRNNC